MTIRRPLTRGMKTMIGLSALSVVGAVAVATIRSGGPHRAYKVLGASIARPTPPTPPSTIILKSTVGISGDVSEPYLPGMSQPLDLSFTNPYNFDIRIVSAAVAVNTTTTRSSSGLANPDCDGPKNLIVTRDFSGTPTAVVVPKNATRALSALAVSPGQWPIVSMPNLVTSQDGCKNTTFHFSFTGTATKP